MNNQQKAYSTDLTDYQWDAISPLFQGMRNRQWSNRELLNAILYKVDNGCKWRNLLHDFPPWQTVYSFFRRAKINGLWDEIMQFLVEITRQIEERNPEPSYGIIDSQSVKTVAASEYRGIDGGKKIKGRKRHIVVDIMWNPLSVVVHAANVHDTKPGIWAAEQAFRDYPGLRVFCADKGYRGAFEREVEERLNLPVDISGSDWEILPKRWIVERTFSWLNNYRGLSKDYEITKSSAESIIKIAHSHTLLKRL